MAEVITTAALSPQQFFAHSQTLKYVIEVDAQFTDHDLVHFAGQPRQPHRPYCPTARECISFNTTASTIFKRAVQHRQYEVLEWLVTSPISTVMQDTLHVFLADMAIEAVAQGDVCTLELLLASAAWSTYPDAGRVHFVSTLCLGD